LKLIIIEDLAGILKFPTQGKVGQAMSSYRTKAEKELQREKGGKEKWRIEHQRARFQKRVKNGGPKMAQIVVATERDKEAIHRVLKGINSLLASLPSYRGDFIEPENIEEYIAMWDFSNLPIIIDSIGGTESLENQFKITADDWGGMQLED